MKMCDDAGDHFAVMLLSNRVQELLGLVLAPGRIHYNGAFVGQYIYGIGGVYRILEFTVRRVYIRVAGQMGRRNPEGAVLSGYGAGYQQYADKSKNYSHKNRMCR
jgi:hypothetical protein